MRSSVVSVTSCSKSIVESAALLGEFGQHRCWFIPFAERRVLLEFLDNFADSHLVGPKEQATAERWKTDAQDQAEVDVSHVAHNFVGKHLCGLDEHRQE